MPSKRSLKHHYFIHSVRLLIRYQQIYMYPFIISVFIILPKVFSINENYLPYLFSFNVFVVLWLYSPFYINQFAYSTEDARSLTLFSLNLEELIIIRNLLSFILLLIPFLLNLVFFALLYPLKDKLIISMTVLSILIIFPAVIIGNLLTHSSISWKAGLSIPWKSIFVVLIALATDLVLRLSLWLLSYILFGLIVILMFSSYVYFYIWSIKKIRKEILRCFSSIAEK